VPDSTQQGSLIELKEVSFAYPDSPDALRDVSLTVDAGEFVAFVGQNGAGKTTCAKLLNDILHPRSGEVWIAGSRTDTVATSELAQTVGYCYQNPDHQIWALKVEDELAFGPRNLGLSTEEVRRRTDEALALIDLAHQRDSYTFSLGWGERQKLAVAAILAMQPRVIVVDEPTTGLDWNGSRRIMDLLSDLNARGLAVIFITHDMAIVAAYARRCVVFAEGRIVRDGPTLDVMYDQEALALADLRPPQFVRLAQELAGDHSIGQVATPDDLKAELTQKLRERLNHVDQ
jgi:energy-coupling factor transport system ATP-binding protein